MEKYSRVLGIVKNNTRETYIDPSAFNVDPVVFTTAPDLSIIANNTNTTDIASAGQTNMYDYLATSDATNLAKTQTLVAGDVAFNQAIQDTLTQQSADDVTTSTNYNQTAQVEAKEQTAQHASTNATIGTIAESSSKTLSDISKDQAATTTAGYKYTTAAVNAIKTWIPSTSAPPLPPTASALPPIKPTQEKPKSDITDMLSTLFKIVASVVVIGAIGTGGYYVYTETTKIEDKNLSPTDKFKNVGNKIKSDAKKLIGGSPPAATRASPWTRVGI